jgi:hypothetical protein
MQDLTYHYYYLRTPYDSIESSYTLACGNSNEVVDTFLTYGVIQTGSTLYNLEREEVENLGNAVGNPNGWFILSDTGSTQFFAIRQDLDGIVNGIQNCASLPTTSTTTSAPLPKVYYQLRSSTYLTSIEACNTPTSSLDLYYTYGTIHTGSTLYYNYNNNIVPNLGGWFSLYDTDSTQFIATHQTTGGVVDSLQICVLPTGTTTTSTTTVPGTTTTTSTTIVPGSIVISRYPLGNIYIGDSVTFEIVSGLTDCNYTSIEWYLDNVLVGTENPLTLTFNTYNTHNMRVLVKNYTTPSWQGGHFYGGTFKGYFAGGTFHYGNLNDCLYISDIPKPKKFTTTI